VKKSILIASIVSAGAVAAQELPALPTLTMPNKGDTINLSVSGGARSALNFGSSTSFGVNVNLTATDGTSVSTKSMLAPAAGSSVLFSIGDGVEKGTSSASIDNIRSQGSGTTNVGGAAVTSTGTNTSVSSGDAEMKGVRSTLDYKLNADKTGFEARANTLHQTYGAIPGQDGKSLDTGNQTATAGGMAILNSNTSVEINSSTFTNVFMQAF